METTELTLVQKAYNYAVKCHSETNHLYDGKPYSYHLKMVYDNGLRFKKCIPLAFIDNVFAACWLHDTIEDCRVTYNDIKSEFGFEVAEIVYALTNDKGKNRKERAGENYYKGIRETKFATFVKLCDRIANVEYSKNTGSSMYEKYKKEMDEFINELDSPHYTIMINHLKSI